MNDADLAAPLLPQETDPADAFEAGDRSSDAGTSYVASQRPAREVKDLFGHMARRARLTTRVRTVASSRNLSRTSIRRPADSAHRQGMPASLRSALLAGTLHVLTPAGTTRVLDEVLTDIGAVNTGTVRIGSGGGLRMRTIVADRPAILRLGKAGTPADPSHHYAALQATADIAQVPTPLGHGRTGGVMWSVESMIQGRVQTQIDRAVILEADQFLRSLPAADRITRPLDQIDDLAALAGPSAGAIQIISDRIGEKLNGLPGVLTHGDFWLGNLLFRKGALAGVVDWDGWEPAGAPATDLLHLLADFRRRRGRTSYGAQAANRFWREAEVRDLLDRHLAALGLPNDSATVDALGESWWLTAVAAAVGRNPKLAVDAAWMQRNLRQAANELADDA